jgi:hypothetical protein
MRDPVYTGTVGLPIRLVLLDDGVVHDPAGATKLQITLRNPDGTSAVKVATRGLTNEATPRPCLEYVSVAGDMDAAGLYVATGYIEDAAGKWPAAPVSWRVYQGAPQGG